MPNSKMVLILEDEPLVSMAMESLVEDAGLTAVPARTVEDALWLLEESDIDCAILDYAVRGENSERVATALRDQRIPFVVCSGSDLPESLEAFSGAPSFSKPYRDEELRAALVSLSGA